MGRPIGERVKESEVQHFFFLFSFVVFDPSERPKVLFKGAWETKILSGNLKS